MSKLTDERVYEICRENYHFPSLKTVSLCRAIEAELAVESEPPAPCPKRSKDIKEIALKVAQNIGLDRPSEFAAAAQMVVDWYIEQQKQAPCPVCEHSEEQALMWQNRAIAAEAKCAELEKQLQTSQNKLKASGRYKLQTRLALAEAELRKAEYALQQYGGQWTEEQSMEVQDSISGIAAYFDQKGKVE
jgi:hypothetical protein